MANRALLVGVNKYKIAGADLPVKVGSRLSLNAIREDLEVSHRAVTTTISLQIGSRNVHDKL